MSNSKLMADFQRLGNDLYWKIYAGEDGFIRWTGYDDAYWWKSVSMSDGFTRQLGRKTGRVFELDATTSQVRVHPFAMEKTDAD